MRIYTSASTSCQLTAGEVDTREAVRADPCYPPPNALVRLSLESASPQIAEGVRKRATDTSSGISSKPASLRCRDMTCLGYGGLGHHALCAATTDTPLHQGFQLLACISVSESQAAMCCSRFNNQLFGKNESPEL